MFLTVAVSLLAALGIAVACVVADIVISVKGFGGEVTGAKEELAAKKRELAAEKSNAEKLQRQKEMACYWTRPWGHVYRRAGLYEKQCEACGKRVGTIFEQKH